MTTQTPGRGRDIQRGIERDVERLPSRFPRLDRHRQPLQSSRCASQAIDIEMTSIADGLTHAVTAADFDAGIWLGQGRYRAACGAAVLVACMSSKPGPRCRHCPPTPSRPLPRSSMFARLVAALTN